MGVGEERGKGSPAPSHLWMFLRTLTKLRFVLDEDSYLVPELDGVRIFSRSTHEFLHEVPGEAFTRAPCKGTWDRGTLALQLLWAGAPEQDQGIEALRQS